LISIGGLSFKIGGNILKYSRLFFLYVRDQKTAPLVAGRMNNGRFSISLQETAGFQPVELHYIFPPPGFYLSVADKLSPSFFYLRQGILMIELL